MTDNHFATVAAFYCVGQTALLGLGLKVAFWPGTANIGAGLPFALLFVGLYSWAMLEVFL